MVLVVDYIFEDVIYNTSSSIFNAFRLTMPIVTFVELLKLSKLSRPCSANSKRNPNVRVATLIIRPKRLQKTSG